MIWNDFENLKPERNDCAYLVVSNGLYQIARWTGSSFKEQGMWGEKIKVSHWEEIKEVKK